MTNASWFWLYAKDGSLAWGSTIAVSDDLFQRPKQDRIRRPSPSFERPRQGQRDFGEPGRATGNRRPAEQRPADAKRQFDPNRRENLRPMSDGDANKSFFAMSMLRDNASR